MSAIKRRHFLQFAGSTLASLGLSQFDVLQQANRYGQVLAQGSPGRKLALLIGIEYAEDWNTPHLPGCITDVALQWHLLVHRYGFHPKDILVLCDRQLDFLDQPPLAPKRQTILDAFEQHLIRQAKAGDTVVFHYSGHGALVADDRSKSALFTEDGHAVDGTIVPLDHLPGKNPAHVRDIMGRSLFLLTDRLQTDNVTVILDSCHSGAGARGGSLVYRSLEKRTSQSVDPASPDELQYQERLLSERHWDEAEFYKHRTKNAKGVAIGSTSYRTLAADACFDNNRFRAGAFTYLLTRYLWQMGEPQSLKIMNEKLQLSTNAIASEQSGLTKDQIPDYEANPQRDDQQPLYFLKPTTPWADAVIRKLASNGEIEFWLGGISTLSLERNSKGSIYSVLDAQQQEVAQIEQTRRDRLLGYGVLKSGTAAAIQPGALMREVIQGIDPNPMLRVAVDPSLGSDAATVKTALQTLPQIQVVPVEQAAYVVGRMTAQYRQQAQQQKLSFIPPDQQFGLFTAAGLHPVEDSFQAADAIAGLMNRLYPKLKSLLAAQILKTITGSDVTTSSRSPSLKVSTAIIPITGRALGDTHAPRFKANTTVKLKLSNQETGNLYIAAISVNSDGSLSFLYPTAGDASEDAALVKAGQSVESAEISLSPPAGFLEVLTIASAKPVRQALLALQRVANARKLESRTAIQTDSDDSLNVMADLLGDFDHNTRASAKVVRNVSGVNKKQVAAFSTILEVVE
jgi:hypothetical protein